MQKMKDRVSESVVAVVVVTMPQSKPVPRLQSASTTVIVTVLVPVLVGILQRVRALQVLWKVREVGR